MEKKLETEKYTQENLFDAGSLKDLKISFLESSLDKQNKKVDFLEKTLVQIKEKYAEVVREVYGTKSEKYKHLEQLGIVFNEVELESLNEDSTEEDGPNTVGKEIIDVKGHTKKRGHRKPLPADLPREIIKVELPEVEQKDEQGNILKIIGYEKSEKLDYEPAKLKVIEYHRAKYGYATGDYVKTAPLKALLPKTMATEGLLSSIIVSKYADGLPLYRQEEIFSRFDIDIPRSTQARWVIQAATKLIPIYNVLNERLLLSDYVSCDETRFQVLKEKDRKAEQQSWMWVRSTPSGQNKIILFDYDPSRAGSVAEKLFLDFKGYLQCDQYGGYNQLEENEFIIRVGCSMHARRYFEKAFTIGSKSGKVLAEQALEFYQKLFSIEEEIREKEPCERKKTREEKSKPIWDEFKEFVDKNKSKIPEESKLGKAFTYFSNGYLHLTKYLEDGRLEIDSGFVERAIRKFTIGRNNWMFADTEAGANSSALLYSLIVTMKVNQVNPYKALKYVLEELAQLDETTSADQLLEKYESLADIILAIKPIPEK